MGALQTEVVDGIAWIQLNVPDQPVNVLSNEVSAEFGSILDSLERDEQVRGAVFISGKKDNFIAGADIEEFVALTTRDEALALVRGGQAMLNRIAKLPKPVVAAIHGACLGGGLELTLACTYRIATDHGKTSLGLPEVQLGIIPAAGGCQRLPRLIGVRAALDIILAGKTVPATRAFQLGMVDELVHPAILKDVAAKAAHKLVGGWRPKRDRGGALGLVLDRNPLGRGVVYSQAKKTVLKKTGGNYPAPLAALEAVGHGMRYGIEAGLDSEAAHFAELAVGGVSRNLVQIFFATTALKKDAGVSDPAPAAKRVANVAVMGAGFMGSAIAGTAVARANVDVRLRDLDLAAVAKGLDAAHRILSDRLKRRRISEHEFRRQERLLTGGVNWAGFGRADLVIEAVFEDLDVKRQVFGATEHHVGPECILASNTSTIPIAKIAQAVQRPERVIGMHFFSPVEKMLLLEVIVTEQTAPWVTVSSVAFGRSMGKTVVVVRDRPGFWVNRILAPYLNEAGRMLKEGVPAEVLDKEMTKFGFPVGPVTLLDEIGLDVALKASAVLHDAYGDRLRPMESLGRMTEEGRLGRKRGRGFYKYENNKRRNVDVSAYEVIGASTENRVPADDVEPRLVFAMLNEACMAFDEGVVRSARDGDIAAIFGIGFPPFRGGPLRYLDHVGPAQAVTTLEELSEKYGDRFQPASRLRRMAAADERFHARSDGHGG